MISLPRVVCILRSIQLHKYILYCICSVICYEPYQSGCWFQFLLAHSEWLAGLMAGAFGEIKWQTQRNGSILYWRRSTVTNLHRVRLKNATLAGPSIGHLNGIIYAHTYARSSQSIKHKLRAPAYGHYVHKTRAYIHIHYTYVNTQERVRSRAKSWRDQKCARVRSRRVSFCLACVVLMEIVRTEFKGTVALTHTHTQIFCKHMYNIYIHEYVNTFGATTTTTMMMMTTTTNSSDDDVDGERRRALIGAIINLKCRLDIFK